MAPDRLKVFAHLTRCRPRNVKAKRPLVPRRAWPNLPKWIALHAERGLVKKCWDGHRLLWAKQDNRRHGACRRCARHVPGGESIMHCKHCSNWSLCLECASSKSGRLPLVAEDPLFHNPSSPCLLSGFVGFHGRGTVIVCPGGNYEFLCPNEGLPLVQCLHRRGIDAFVLRYRLLPRFCLKDALSDLENAVALVRRCRPGPVAAMGFSAGGHLVASLALRIRKPLDAQVLVYPAIDPVDWLDPEKAAFVHEGSFERSPELQANRHALLGGPGFAAPATFLVSSTKDDCCKPEEHCDPYAKALKKRRIPHVYLRRNFGDHGFGANGGWFTSCADFLQKRGFGRISALG